MTREESLLLKAVGDALTERVNSAVAAMREEMRNGTMSTAQTLREEIREQGAPGSYRVDFPGPKIENVISVPVPEVTVNNVPANVQINVPDSPPLPAPQVTVMVDMQPIADAVHSVLKQMTDLIVALNSAVSEFAQLAKRQRPPVVKVPERKPIAFRLETSKDGIKRVVPEVAPEE